MIFKPSMIVLIANGRLAGKKAVIIKELENNMVVVSGVFRVPVASPEYLPSWQKRRNEKFVTFVKKINIKHLVATRYKADVGLDKLDVASAVESPTGRAVVNGEANKILKSAYEAKKAKWLFTDLKF